MPSDLFYFVTDAVHADFQKQVYLMCERPSIASVTKSNSVKQSEVLCCCCYKLLFFMFVSFNVFFNKVGAFYVL